MTTLEDIYSRLRTLEERHKENMFEIEKRFIKLENTRPARMDTDERVSDLEDLLRMNELEIIKLNERLSAGADATGIIPASLETRLENIERNLATNPSGLGDVGSDSGAKIDALEERITDLENTSRDNADGINVKVNEINSRIKDIKHTDLGDMERKISQLKGLEERLDSELEKRRDVITKLNNVSLETDKITAAMTSARSVEERLRNDIELLSTEKAEIFKRVDNAFKHIHALEEDIEQRMSNSEAKIRTGLDKITNTQEVLDTQMARLDRKFDLIEKGGLSDEVLKSMTKRTMEYQYKINELAEQMKNLDISRMEHYVEDLAGRIDQAEKRADERSLKFLTEQLEQFAKAVDDRIPQLPSHSQFDNILRRIDQIDTKIMHIQRPNMAPMEQRVAELSGRLDRVIDVIRRLNDRMSSRTPIVVD